MIQKNIHLVTPSAIPLSTLTHANFVKPYTDGVHCDNCNRTDRGYPKKVRINRQYSINNLWSRQVSSLTAKSQLSQAEAGPSFTVGNPTF